MRIGLLVVFGIMAFSAAAVTAAQAAPAASQPRYAAYKGAWFTVDYPKGWKVTPLSRSASSMTGSDSARFTAPDGSVEFYIFSPLWNGDPKEISLDPKCEALVSHTTQSAPRVKMKTGGYVYNPVAQWYTARAKDNSYQRSWLDVEDKGLNVRHVFGIKYRDAQAYKKHKAEYDHFRKSLEQFSD